VDDWVSTYHSWEQLRCPYAISNLKAPAHGEPSIGVRDILMFSMLSDILMFRNLLLLLLLLLAA
jgi:hypothetical protein